jgi:hypothetical protein
MLQWYQWQYDLWEECNEWPTKWSPFRQCTSLTAITTLLGWKRYGSLNTSLLITSRNKREVLYCFVGNVIQDCLTYLKIKKGLFIKVGCVVEFIYACVRKVSETGWSLVQRSSTVCLNTIMQNARGNHSIKKILTDIPSISSSWELLQTNLNAWKQWERESERVQREINIKVEKFRRFVICDIYHILKAWSKEGG